MTKPSSLRGDEHRLLFPAVRFGGATKFGTPWSGRKPSTGGGGIGTIITRHGGTAGDPRGSLQGRCPTTPTELGIPDEIAVEAIITAKEIRPERFTILDMGISRESAEHLVHMLYAE